MKWKLVTSLSEALLVRTLRNGCYENLTNHRERIGLIRQVRWYLTYYRAAQKQGSYRIFLLLDEQPVAVGYGALLRKDGKLLVTECIAPTYRRQGYGKRILEELIQIAQSEERDLVAEIWGQNVASVKLHEACGFVRAANQEKFGMELRSYVLEVSRS